MRPLLLVLAIVSVGLGVACAPATARIQDGILCYEPDFEWPLPCDDDD